MEYFWVIEALESSVSKPDYFHDISKGYCFFLWTDEIEFAKKFNSIQEAQEWATDHRLHCGIRICEHAFQSHKQTQTQRRL